MARPALVRAVRSLAQVAHGQVLAGTEATRRSFDRRQQGDGTGKMTNLARRRLVLCDAKTSHPDLKIGALDLPYGAREYVDLALQDSHVML
jgi:hypothetical protein